MTRVDLHQHMWTPTLVEALRARSAPPRIARNGDFDVLYAAAEQPWPTYLIDHDPGERVRLLREEGLERAVIAMSSPLGIEALPRTQALELIDAHLAGVDALPDGFRSWGPIALDGARAEDVDALLARGCVGISLPAGALAGIGRLELADPILERAASAGAPVFVHPGPAPGQHGGEAQPHEPLWWRAMTDYVSQMQAAWLTFATAGRQRHPGLVVVFAMLAGGGPLQAERLVGRGGPAVDLQDPLTFYDTSSYGPSAIEGIGSIVGPRQLVYGSDRPVVDPIRFGRDSLLQAQAGELLGAHAVAAQ